MKSFISYQRKDKNKVRTITTYKNNTLGNNLRIKHLKQKKVLYNIFKENKTNHSFAYEKNSNTKKMVLKHIESKYFLKVDIFSFFDNINHELLEQKLMKKKNYNINFKELIEECSTFKEKDKGIAIGLIPSPILANIYLEDFDKKLGDKLVEIGDIIYTRYADDIIISSKEEFDRANVKDLIEFFLLEERLYLNDSKIQKVDLNKKGKHIKITGLNIVRGERTNYITISRKFKKTMKKDNKTSRKNSRERYIMYNEYSNK